MHIIPLGSTFGNPSLGHRHCSYVPAFESQSSIDPITNWTVILYCGYRCFLLHPATNHPWHNTIPQVLRVSQACIFTIEPLDISGISASAAVSQCQQQFCRRDPLFHYPELESLVHFRCKTLPSKWVGLYSAQSQRSKRPQNPSVLWKQVGVVEDTAENRSNPALVAQEY
jgi:hypothetical protein